MTEDLTHRLHAVDDKLTLILTTVQSLTVRVDNVDSRLERLERTVDEGQHVMKRVVVDIAQLQQGQRRLEHGLHGLEGQLEGLEGRQQGLEGRLHGLEEGLHGLEEGQASLRSDLTAFRRHVDLQFRTLSGTVEGRFREHDQRIARLEANANQANSQT